MRTSTAYVSVLVASGLFLVAPYAVADVIPNSDRIVISANTRTATEFGTNPCTTPPTGVCFNPLDQSFAETDETGSPFSSFIGVRSGTHNATFNTAVALIEPGDGIGLLPGISDLVELSAVATPAGVQSWTLNFFSDTEVPMLSRTDLFLVGPPAQVQETGGLQDISGLFLDSDGVTRITPLFNVLVQSDLEPVPEPATWLLLGSGLVGVTLWRRWQLIINSQKHLAQA